MRKTLIFLSLVFLFAVNGKAESLNNAVVKIFVTSDPANFYHPWQSNGTQSSTGSGAIIKGNLILTNAHVVADQTFIQVKKNQDAKKYTARLLSVQHQCDLALLQVEDQDFFKGTKALESGELPMLQDTVSVLGFPTGGDKLSVTEGVVSRIEVTRYVQSMRQLLAVQIDAAINPGNSGGPVIMNGKLVGIAMQGNPSAQNIGYMIPTEIIEHYFTDLEDGELNGFPIIGITLNKTENQTLREHYQIGDSDRGLLITNTTPHSSADGTLKKGDIILSVDDIDIGMDGTYAFRQHERLSMTHLISDKQVGDMIKFDIIREGKKKSLKIKIKQYLPLVPPLRHFDKPSYYIHGGFIFTILSNDFFTSWGKNWWSKLPINLSHYRFGLGQSNNKRHKNKVALIYVLPDQINIGYHDSRNIIVRKVNGVEITSFQQFVMLLQKVQDEEDKTIIETMGDDIFILDNKGLDKINAEILKRYRIPVQYSENIGKWIENL